jgi:hypothetical protein
MMKRFAVGDLVTVRPPYEDVPLIVSLQPHARIAQVLPPTDAPRYLIELLSTFFPAFQDTPADPSPQRAGPFPATRLDRGWSNHGVRFT